MAKSSNYKKAYDTAKRELAQLLSQQEALAKRLVTVRESIQTLATLCESEGIIVVPSAEATHLLITVTLADEIRVILRATSPEWLRPAQVKGHLARLGHDLSKYQNPQATIQMVLKRMAESGEVEEMISNEGKKAYRVGPPNYRDAVLAAAEKVRK
jgi:hypothetical protein